MFRQPLSTHAFETNKEKYSVSEINKRKGKRYLPFDERKFKEIVNKAK